MRLAHHLLRHTSGVFHFRLVVPGDLQGLFGVRIIKRSLRTRERELSPLTKTLNASVMQRLCFYHRSVDSRAALDNFEQK